MDRRKFLKMTAAAAATSTLPRTAVRAADPIRIGLMAPLTGVVAAGGREVVDGFNLYWAKAGKTIAGRPIEITVEDDGSNPDTALQKARRLVEQSKVHFLIGNILANTGLAVAEYVKSNGVPYFIPIIAADDLTQRRRIANVVRIAGFAASQTTRPLADYAYKKLGYRKIVTVSQDYTFGHEQVGGFAQTFTEAGGTIASQLWNPLNTSDFSPYFAQIQAAKPDAVFAMELGADASRFFQQWAAFGLKNTIPLIGGSNFSDQSVIRTSGAEVDGVLTSHYFAEGNDNPATVAFVAEYQKAYGILPSFYGASLYLGAMWVAEAIKAADGNVEDRVAFLDAIRKVVLNDSPLGRPVRLDAYGNPVYDVFIRKVTRRPDGKFWNTVVEVYPEVSQFWNYKPEDYLKQPAYSRTFQGIKKN